MDISIRKLTPDLAEAYVHFFDVTPHDDYTEGAKCYCVGWCSDDSEGKDFSSWRKRREYALQLVRDGCIQGYLAYQGDEIVGWCNANTKSDCLQCCGGRGFITRHAPVKKRDAGVRVKSIFCFVIAPEMQRKGIATQLVERVCQDAAADGFDFVEAYPNKKFNDIAHDFMGPLAMYKKCGFVKYAKAKDKIVMRKALK
ncbi:MAG: GNAT family N-acetyltransferase [Oscillospiraceae bacterium]|nr:GNAT family N-acetyltransferase [Oscillospiraceae bacterium]